MAEGHGEWQPLSVREGTREQVEQYEALHEGVPPWLEASLWEWIQERVCVRQRGMWFVRPERLREIERKLRLYTGWDGTRATEGRDALQKALRDNERLMLDTADLLVSQVNPSSESAALVELHRILEQAGSVWDVIVTDDGPRLARRVESSVVAAARQSMSDATSGRLLAKAWVSVYGRDPHPSDGYRQAVRAVEAASIPVVLPNDRDATLGRVIGTLRGERDRWTFALSHRNDEWLPVETVIGMLDLLWGSQHDRHVNPDDEAPLHVSQEEAETAIHLAVVLVQWFTRGTMKRAGSVQ